MQLKRSTTATHFCKVCHRKIEQNSIFNLVFTAKSICLQCFYSLKPRTFSWIKKGVRCLSLYTYSDEFKSMIYLYKECGDIEMAPVFLERLLPFLKVRYHGYILVPAPSHEEKILQRGFDHLPLMFKGLGKGVVHAILKKRNVKQTDLSMVERKQISSNLGGIKGVDFSGKKVLLVDDVYTTGSTISACIDIVKRMHPKKLKVLVLAKVPKNRKQGNEELTVG